MPSLSPVTVPVIQQFRVSRRGFWPQAGDLGTAIEGTFVGTLTYAMPSRRLPVVLLEDLAGQARYTPVTKELARDIRRLRVGDHVRFTFVGLHPHGHHARRRIAVARILNGTNGA